MANMNNALAIIPKSCQLALIELLMAVSCISFSVSARIWKRLVSSLAFSVSDLHQASINGCADEMIKSMPTGCGGRTSTLFSDSSISISGQFERFNPITWVEMSCLNH